MVIKAETKYGGSAKDSRDGFKLALAANVNEEQRDRLASIGLASVAYRAGANVINKALKVDTNTLAEYSEESADAITAALAEWGQAEKDNPLGAPFDLSAVVSRHEHGQKAAIKYAAERKVWERNAKADSLDKLAEKIGFTGGWYADDAEEAPAIAMLQAIKAYIDASL